MRQKNQQLESTALPRQHALPLKSHPLPPSDKKTAKRDEMPQRIGEIW